MKLVKKHYMKNGKYFRYGGDEFCVIMTKNIDSMDQLNQNLLKTIEKRKEEEPILPSVSIGYSYYDLIIRLYRM